MGLSRVFSNTTVQKHQFFGLQLSLAGSGGLEVKASAHNAGDLDLIPGSGRSSGERNGNPLQYSCLENPMDRGAWLAIVRGVTKSRTQLSNFTFAFFVVQISDPYKTTGKTIALTRWTFVGNVMSLLLNMLSKLVITFLPRSKRLLISWLQSPSAVILEPKKVKSDTVSTVSPSISHEVMGLDGMIFVF